MANNTVDMEHFKGKTFTKIDTIKDNYGEKIVFYTQDKKFEMYHNQDCCENVYIEDICGDLDDIIDSPILLAEEVVNTKEDLLNIPNVADVENSDESYTWTFYKFATIKGYVTIRWYGSSNGHYSESVNIYSEDLK